MSRRLKSEDLSVTRRDRNVIHHNEAENEEFVFYDDDKRCGARGRTVVTLQPPGDSGERHYRLSTFTNAHVNSQPGPPPPNPLIHQNISQYLLTL